MFPPLHRRHRAMCGGSLSERDCTSLAVNVNLSHSPLVVTSSYGQPLAQLWCASRLDAESYDAFSSAASLLVRASTCVVASAPTSLSLCFFGLTFVAHSLAAFSGSVYSRRSQIKVSLTLLPSLEHPHRPRCLLTCTSAFDRGYRRAQERSLHHGHPPIVRPVSQHPA